MSILIKPIITEKATKDAEDKNRYTFSVDKKANKIQIKKAVEAAYGVNFDGDEEKIVAHLFKLYAQATA